MTACPSVCSPSPSPTAPPEDDRLPKRLLTEPITNGPSKGMVSQLPLTLPEYYAARGWVNAFPTDETLKKLGLDECVGK